MVPVAGHGARSARKRSKAADSKAEDAAATTTPGEDSEAGALASAGPANFRMHVHMQLLVAFDFVGPDEAVVVQQPWLAIVKQLPAKLHRRRYGT